MERTLIEEGFNRRYVLLPLLLSIALVVLGFGITEIRRNQTKLMSEQIRERQDVMRVLAESIYQALESESAQRGFLITGDEQYLEPYHSGLTETTSLLDEVTRRYQKLEPAEVLLLQQTRRDILATFAEMDRSIALMREGHHKDAIALVSTDVGLLRMRGIRDSLEGLRSRERQRIYDHLAKWTSSTRLNTIINAFSTVFTLAVLVILGLVATRDIRRRELHTSELEQAIAARTAELRDLSQHMSRVAETEKHALSRELHDELGGLLVAMRMDISQIRKRLGPGTPDLDTRWQRIDQALTAGIELKRRVIEELRPTLLDNMGLFAALRWHATQHCERSGLRLHLECPEVEPELAPDVSIALFRTIQEALANVVKHAGASDVVLTIRSADTISVIIADNGSGIPANAAMRVGSHGLRQMKFRMEAVGGTFGTLSNTPHGTIIQLSVANSLDGGIAG